VHKRRPEGGFVARDPMLHIVLDGRSRLDAMELAGFTIVNAQGQLDQKLFGRAFAGKPNRLEQYLTILDKDEVEPFAYVISANIHRRHLDAEGKRKTTAALLKANPDRSNNATAKLANVDDKTVANVRRDLEARSEIPNVKTRTDTKGRRQPASRVRRKGPVMN
jgi:hypothetical protein